MKRYSLDYLLDTGLIEHMPLAQVDEDNIDLENYLIENDIYFYNGFYYHLEIDFNFGGDFEYGTI